MNSFDLDITAVSVPAGLGADAGAASLREMATMQEGTARNDLKLSRAMGEPREFLRRLGALLFNRNAHSSSFMAVGSRPWLTVA